MYIVNKNGVYKLLVGAYWDKAINSKNSPKISNF
jgi:hypothetical protein